MPTRSSWRFIGLLHNLPLETAVETPRMAVAPYNDARLSANLENKDFRHFVTSFRDQFGRSRQPSALLARGAVRRKPEAVLAFRNALAVSAVTRAWTRFLGADRQLEYFKYSGYFDLYPHYLSSDYSNLIVNSASLLGVDETKEFRGQTAPELGPASPQKDFYDETLFGALMRKHAHERSFLERNWEKIALAVIAAFIGGAAKSALDKLF